MASSQEAQSVLGNSSLGFIKDVHIWSYTLLGSVLVIKICKTVQCHTHALVFDSYRCVQPVDTTSKFIRYGGSQHRVCGRAQWLSADRGSRGRCFKMLEHHWLNHIQRLFPGCIGRSVASVDLRWGMHFLIWISVNTLYNLNISN